MSVDLQWTPTKNKDLGNHSSSALESQQKQAQPFWNFIFPVVLVLILSYANRNPVSTQNQVGEWVAQSKKLTAEKKFQEAFELQKKLLQMFPRNHIYLDEAINSAIALGDFTQAAQYLETFMQVSPNPDEACLRLHQSYNQLGNKMKMLDAAQRCLKMDPGNSDFVFQYAISLERLGQFEKALGTYSDGKTRFPGYTDFVIGFARTNLHLGHSEKAWHAIQPVLQRQPGLEDAQVVAVNAAMALGLWDQAEAMAKEGVQQHPQSSDLNSALQKILQQKGSQK